MLKRANRFEKSTSEAGQGTPSSSTGKAAVFQVTEDRSLMNDGEGFVGPNAHTVSVNPQSRRVYFPLENLRGRAVLRVMEDP
jgi:hypothetical protein